MIGGRPLCRGDVGPALGDTGNTLFKEVVQTCSKHCLCNKWFERIQYISKCSTCFWPWDVGGMTALRQIWDCPEAAKKKQLLSACSKSYLYYFVLIFIYLAHPGKTKQHPHRFDLGFRFVWVCALSWVCKCMNYACSREQVARIIHPKWQFWQSLLRYDCTRCLSRS